MKPTPKKPSLRIPRQTAPKPPKAPKQVPGKTLAQAKKLVAPKPKDPSKSLNDMEDALGNFQF